MSRSVPPSPDAKSPCGGLANEVPLERSKSLRVKLDASLKQFGYACQGFGLWLFVAFLAMRHGLFLAFLVLGLVGPLVVSAIVRFVVLAEADCRIASLERLKRDRREGR